MPEGFTTAELQAAINILPVEGLESVAQTLSQALTGSEEQRESYWQNRIAPFWKKMWPKDRRRTPPRISDLLVQLILQTGDAFPSAFELLRNWLMPVEFHHYPLHLMEGANLCHRFPDESTQVAEPDT